MLSRGRVNKRRIRAFPVSRSAGEKEAKGATTESEIGERERDAASPEKERNEDCKRGKGGRGWRRWYGGEREEEREKVRVTE